MNMMPKLQPRVLVAFADPADEPFPPNRCTLPGVPFLVHGLSCKGRPLQSYLAKELDFRKYTHHNMLMVSLKLNYSKLADTAVGDLLFAQAGLCTWVLRQARSLQYDV